MEDKETRIKIKKVFKYFINLKSFKKPKTELELASLFTSKEDYSNTKLVYENNDTIYATDTYCLIAIEKKVKDDKGDRYYFKEEPTKIDGLFVECEKVIKEKFEECNEVFKMEDHVSSVDGEGNSFLLINNKIDKSRFNIKLLNKFYNACTNLKYRKPENCSSHLSMTGEFKGSKAIFLLMPLLNK